MTAGLGLVLVVALAFSGAALAQGGSDDNRGTIKIHDDATAEPDERNEPHVSCDFFVQGFNMKDPSGHLRFYAWPPTSNKQEVTPTGDTLAWVGTPDGDGEYDFLKGPYFLPDGHYRVEAYTHDGHPGHEHFAKAKMFWVDPCEEEEPPCVDNPDTPVDDCNPPPCVDDEQTEVDECNPPPCVDDEQTEVDECNPPPPCVDDEQTEIDECDETEIPFFPGFTSLALGSLGALAMVGLALRRRS